MVVEFTFDEFLAHVISRSDPVTFVVDMNKREIEDRTGIVWLSQ